MNRMRIGSIILITAVCIALTGCAEGESESDSPTLTPTEPQASSTITSATPTSSEAVVPTPDSGGQCITDSTDVAQQMTAFELVLPDPVADGFQLDGVVVEAPFVPDPAATLSCEDGERASIFYQAADCPEADDRCTVQVLETTIPSAQDDGEVVEVNGVEVVRATTTNAEGEEVLSFEWTTDESVTIQVFGKLGEAVTEEVLASFVEAMV